MTSPVRQDEVQSDRRRRTTQPFTTAALPDVEIGVRCVTVSTCVQKNSHYWQKRVTPQTQSDIKTAPEGGIEP